MLVHVGIGFKDTWSAHADGERPPNDLPDSRRTQFSPTLVDIMMMSVTDANDDAIGSRLGALGSSLIGSSHPH